MPTQDPTSRGESNAVRDNSPMRIDGEVLRDIASGNSSGRMRRNPRAIATTVTAILATGMLVGWLVGRTVESRTRIERRLAPRLATELSGDLRDAMSLDLGSVREQVLSADNILRASRAAGRLDQAGAATRPPISRGLIDRTRTGAQIVAWHGDDSIDTIDIRVQDTRGDGLTRFTDELANGFIEHTFLTQKAAVEFMLAIAARQKAAMETNAAELTSLKRLIVLEAELTKLESESKSIRTSVTSDPAAIESEPAQIDTAPAEIVAGLNPVELRWQAVLDLERQLTFNKLSREQRKRTQRKIDQLRREAGRADSPFSTPGHESAAMTRKSDAAAKRRADADRQLHEIRARVDQCRQAIREIEAALTLPRSPGLTLASLDRAATGVQQRIREMDSQADRLRVVLAAIDDRRSIECVVQTAAPQLKLAQGRFSACMIGTLVLCLIGARVVGRITITRDTSFQSADEAQQRLGLPVLGVLSLRTAHRFHVHPAPARQARAA